MQRTACLPSLPWTRTDVFYAVERDLVIDTGLFPRGFIHISYGEIEALGINSADQHGCSIFCRMPGNFRWFGFSLTTLEMELIGGELANQRVGIVNQKKQQKPKSYQPHNFSWGLAPAQPSAHALYVFESLRRRLAKAFAKTVPAQDSANRKGLLIPIGFRNHHPHFPVVSGYLGFCPVGQERVVIHDE